MIVKYLSSRGPEVRDAAGISYSVIYSKPDFGYRYPKLSHEENEQLTHVLRLSFNNEHFSDVCFDVTEAQYKEIAAEAYEKGRIDLTELGTAKYIN